MLCALSGCGCRARTRGPNARRGEQFVGGAHVRAAADASAVFARSLQRRARAGAHATGALLFCPPRALVVIVSGASFVVQSYSCVDCMFAGARICEERVRPDPQGAAAQPDPDLSAGRLAACSPGDWQQFQSCL